MTKQVIYKYLGTNGVIESPVHLENIYSIKTVRLIADVGKILTDGNVKVYTTRVPEEEVENWKEIKDI